jgi:hypothetical protein
MMSSKVRVNVRPVARVGPKAAPGGFSEWHPYDSSRVSPLATPGLRHFAGDRELCMTSMLGFAALTANLRGPTLRVPPSRRAYRGIDRAEEY